MIVSYLTFGINKFPFLIEILKIINLIERFLRLRMQFNAFHYKIINNNRFSFLDYSSGWTCRIQIIRSLSVRLSKLSSNSSTDLILSISLVLNSVVFNGQYQLSKFIQFKKLGTCRKLKFETVRLFCKIEEVISY